MFFITITFFGSNTLKSVSMNDQESKIRPQKIDINSHEPSFYPYSVKINKGNGSCNNINDSYVKLCVPDVIKNINVKVFNLMSRTNEIKYIKWYETCKCKCRLNARVCNNKEIWSKDKCRCECNELIDEGYCDKGTFWNPSISECEHDKSCDIGQYLDYKNCKCKKN